MTISMNGVLRLRLACSALSGLVALAFVPTATAQWAAAPWRAEPPGEIERSLNAQGYALVAPLMRRPGIYLADVIAGPAGYQRLVIDARSGQILERFLGAAHMWGPALAARNEELGEPRPRTLGRRGVQASQTRLGPVLPRNRPSEVRGTCIFRSPSAHTASGEAPAGTKPKPKSVSTERKAPATKGPTANPPLPPPAPREAASAAPPTTANTPAETSDKPKVSIVPPALFE